MQAATHQRLRRAAVRAVRTWPDIDAVVLFGSRARGAARPSSDWDVAILLREAPPADARAACALFATLAKVNPIIVSSRDVYEHRNHGARIESAIARQGQVLAGAWTRPDCLEEGLAMEPVEFREQLVTATRDIENAIGTLCSAAEDGDTYVPNAVELSQNAAETVGKNVVIGFGLSPAAVHDLDALASQLENAYRGRRQGAEDRKAFASLLRELNGNTRAAHTARYSMSPVEKPERTVERLVRTLRLESRWLRYYAEQHPEAGPEVMEVGRRIARTASRLEQREGFGRLPPPLRSATKTWGKEGESIAKPRGPERSFRRGA